MSKVIIYSKTICPYCVKAKALIKRKSNNFDIEMIEIKIDNNQDLHNEMKQKSGGRMTVPQIFINDIHVGGCDDLYALEEQKKLDELLK
jgi:glutaredoxin 3